MRHVRVSKTFLSQLNELIEQGYPRFGQRVVTEKRDLVFQLIHGHLAMYPRKPRDRGHGMCVYAVSKTPFALIYDFDDVELRVLFIFHQHADLSQLDPAAVQW